MTKQLESQEQLPFGFRWGGSRKGAGRRKKENAGIPHTPRPALAKRFPVHVTARVLQEIPLRHKRVFPVVQEALRSGSQKEGFRLVHFSVQWDHVHLIVEAHDRQSLSRGLQGLFVRVAKALGRLLERRGSIFVDRYHEHILRTPREVKNALRYVLGNGRRHGLEIAVGQPDPCSSGRWFDGWNDYVPKEETILARAKTWLLIVGWRRHGEIPIAEVSPH